MSDELADLIEETARVCEFPNSWSQEVYDAMLALEEVAKQLAEARRCEP